MKLTPGRLIGPLVSLLVLVVVLVQTGASLRATGAWSRRAAAAGGRNPYERLERLLASPGTDAPAVNRDPFAYGAAPAPVVSAPAPRPRPAPPAPAPPKIIALVADSRSASAIVRWLGRDTTVREADTLPGGFVVLRITSEEVVLQRGGETIVLRVPKKGD